MKSLALISLSVFSLLLGGCGNSSSALKPQSTLSGNWQVNLSQSYPTVNTLSASGFFIDSSGALTGSAQGPTVHSPNGNRDCGGVGPLTGTVDGQSVTFSLNPGGTSFTFTGAISSDNTTMSGSYQALPGDCFTTISTGTWTAALVPALNGTFSGTLSNSQYMSLVTGVNPPDPVAVTGTLTQSANAGASNATLTGTITASGYPCFTTASLTGTISGQSVILSIFGFDGTEIGEFGVSSAPASASGGTSGGMEVDGTFTLGKSSATTTVGPCPPLNGGSGTKIGDSSVAVLTLQ